MLASLAGLRCPDVFVVPLAARTLARAIHEIVHTLWTAEKIGAVEAAIAGIEEREREGSTVFAEGVAAPHARLPDFEGVLFGVGIAPCGISAGRGESPVHLVMLSLSGSSSLNEYLALLSGIGRVASNPGLLRRLMAAHSPEEAAACFSRRPGHYRSSFTSLFAPLVPSPIYEIA